MSKITDDPFFRKLAWKGITMLIVSTGLIMLLGYFLHKPVTTLAVQLVDLLGPVGIFLGVLASDALGFPVPPTTYLFAAVAADAPVTLVLIITAIASIIGGNIAYLIGPYVGRLPLLNKILERYRIRGEATFKRWGVWTIGIAAITPLPFPIFCWLAGIYRMPYVRFFLATLIRAPRILAYYGFFALGWAAAI